MFDPEICHGKPVIPGTRTPVAGILSVLSAGGDGFETPQGEFNITAEGIRVCIGFAAKEIDEISNWPVMV